MIGIHHYYFGLLALALSWFGMWRDWPIWLFVSLFVVGVWLCADDLYQHYKQREILKWLKENAVDPDDPVLGGLSYHSPVHNIYVWAFGWLHRRVVRLFKRG